MTELVERRCVPCEGGVAPLTPAEADALGESTPGWIRAHDRIHRDFLLADFRACIDWIRDVADLADDEGHHPDLLLHGFRNVRITLWTHAIHGLSDNDYILAAKIDRLWGNRDA